MRFFVRTIDTGVTAFQRVTAPIQRLLQSTIVLPVYKAAFFAQLRVKQTLASTRGVIFLVFTSKYSLHVLFVGVAITFTVLQLAPSTASADIGKRSILYALVTNGEASVTTETGVSLAKATTKPPLDETIEAFPAIDYGLEETADAYAYAPDQGLAGNLAWEPIHTPAIREGAPSIPPTTVATEEPPATPTKRTEVITYTIRSGDTLARIAQNHQVNVSTITWANNLTERSVLRPGNTLRIPPVSGVLHTVKKGETLSSIAARYNIPLSSIREQNTLGASLTLGTELVIPNGKPVVAVATPVRTPTPTPKPTTTTAPKPAATTPTITAPTAKTPKVTGRVAVKPGVPISGIRNKAYDIYQELSNSKEDNRDKPEDKEDTSKTKLLWPTRSFRVNQYYGWNHTGLDIDGDYTDPIYASEDGTVTQSGWNSGGYGLQIVIDHPSGFRTRYAHASKLFVKAGDEVKRGEVIGYVGTTGRSTGTHLHYEVYLNGVRKNPLTYTR